MRPGKHLNLERSEPGTFGPTTGSSLEVDGLSYFDVTELANVAIGRLSANFERLDQLATRRLICRDGDGIRWALTVRGHAVLDAYSTRGQA